MIAAQLSVGFLPLVDAAPLIVAHEMGFAAEESIALDLRRAPSWSSVRDLLTFGRVEAAHMLSPVPVAAALGLGGTGTALSAVTAMAPLPDHRMATGSPSRPRSAVTTVSGMITVSGKASTGPESGRKHHRNAMTYREAAISRMNPADGTCSLPKLMHLTDTYNPRPVELPGCS